MCSLKACSSTQTFFKVLVTILILIKSYFIFIPFISLSRTLQIQNTRDSKLYENYTSHPSYIFSARERNGPFSWNRRNMEDMESSRTRSHNFADRSYREQRSTSSSRSFHTTELNPKFNLMPLLPTRFDRTAHIRLRP